MFSLNKFTPQLKMKKSIAINWFLISPALNPEIIIFLEILTPFMHVSNREGLSKRILLTKSGF